MTERKPAVECSANDQRAAARVAVIECPDCEWMSMADGLPYGSDVTGEDVLQKRDALVDAGWILSMSAGVALFRRCCTRHEHLIEEWRQLQRETGS